MSFEFQPNLTFKIKTPITIRTIRAKIEASKSVRDKSKALSLAKADSEFDGHMGLLHTLFEGHAVTLDLPEDKVGSTVLGTSSYGNLFSFAGFYAGQDPIGEIRNSLTTSIFNKSLRKQRVSKGKMNFAWQIKYSTPSLSEFNSFGKATKIAELWTGNSFLYDIELGIPNVERYIYRKNSGRSRQGLLVKGAVENPSPESGREEMREPKREYMTDIMRQFAEALNRK